ncbi:MAG: hypothetical protein Q9166_003353 [cf. Caloplaca sp. 2 TL-2023]
MAEQTSQWTTDFVGFVDSLETQGILTQQRDPSTFAYAVFVDGTTYSTEIGLSILVTVTDELTIVVPYTRAEPAKYIDIPLQNIINVQVEAGGPGSQSKQNQPAKPAVLVVHLSGITGATYFINELARPPCRINLAFDTIDDAKLTKDQIETMTERLSASKPPNGRNETDASKQQEKTYPVELLSHSAILDVSSRPSGQKNTFSAMKPLGLRALQPTNLMATASQAHELLTGSSASRSKKVTPSNSNTDLTKDQADLASRSEVLVATEVINVSQKAAPKPISAQGPDGSNNPLEIRRRSSSVWRDGMDTIENATELQSDPKAAQSTVDQDQAEAKRIPEAMSEDDDDFCFAIPRASKTQPVTGSRSRPEQRAGNQIFEDTARQNSLNGVSRKLSRSMWTNDGEQSSAFPRVEVEDLHQHKASSTKLSSLNTAHAKGTKRTNAGKQAAGPNKRTKLQDGAVERSNLHGDATSVMDTPIEGSIFDLPPTPPDRQKASPTPRKPAESKPKAPKSKRVGAKVNTSNTQTNDQVKIAKKASKPKVTSEPSIHTEIEAYAQGKHEHDYNQLGDVNDAADVEQDDAAFPPAGKQPRKPKSQAARKTRAVETNQSSTVENLVKKQPRQPKPQANKKTKAAEMKELSNVKNEKILEKSESSGAARTLRSTRAAKQKANQLMQEMLDDGEYESVEEEQSRRGGDEIVQQQVVDKPDHQELLADSAGHILGSKNKTSSPTGDDIIDQIAFVAQPTASKLRASMADDLEIQTQPALPQMKNKPSARPVEHHETRHSALPTRLEASRTKQTEMLGRDLFPASSPISDNKEEARHDMESCKGSNGVAPIDGGVADNQIQHGPEDSNFEEAIAALEPDIGDTSGGDPHVIGAPGNLSNNHKPRDSTPVPPGFGVDTHEQVLLALQPGKPSSPEAEAKPHQRSFEADKDRNEGEIAAEAPRNPQGKDRQSPACGQVSGHHQHDSNISSKRTAPAHLASHLYNTLSSVLNAHGPVQQSTSGARKERQSTAMHQKTNQEAATATPRIAEERLSRQGGDSSSKHTKERRLDISLAEAATAGSKQLPNVPEISTGPSVTQDDSKPIEKDQQSTSPNSDPYTIMSGPSDELGPIDVPEAALTSIEPQLLEQIPSDHANLPISTTHEQTIAPARPPIQPQQISDHPIEKKRSRDAENQRPSKKTKLHAQANVTPGTENVEAEPAVYKDPSRLPQVISFGAKGPRNQGLSPPKRKTMSKLHADGSESQESTRGRSRKRKWDAGLNNEDGESLHALAQLQEPRDSKRARIKGPAHTRVVSGNVQPEVQKRPPLAIQQPRGRARASLPTHSSVLGDKLEPHIPSQGSRVDENGSPLPSQRTRNFKRAAEEQHNLDETDSERENIEPPWIDDEAALAPFDTNADSDFDLPAIPKPKGIRKKGIAVIGSSNSKHGPSSPNAPSAMLTDIQAHALHPGGRLVNVDTDAVLVPATPHDPFTGRKSWRSNGFLERLRRQSDGYGKKEWTTSTRKVANMPLGGFPSTVADPDQTLVEAQDVKHQPKRPRRATPVSSSISDASTSQQQSQSSKESDEQIAARERWYSALEPYQRDMLGVLYEISHKLIGHLIDTETAINDVVDDYQRRGLRFNENLANDLERELGQYNEIAKERRGEDVERYQILNARVSKNLKRKPVAEDLARKTEEKRQVLNAKMKEAIGLCD